MRLDVDFTLTLAARRRRFRLEVRFASDDARVVMFGPSGAGKSATLQAIAGLLRPERGRIEVGGRVLFDAAGGIDLPARERRIGYVFQDYALFPHLSVWDNVAYGLRHGRHWRLDESERAQVADLLASMGLDGLAAARPATLSGGQRQRVALARALVRSPDMLLLDEPFAALDVHLRRRLRDELAEVQARFGVPLVLITHDLQDVEHLAQTLVVIDAGSVTRVVPLGPLRDAMSPEALRAELARTCGIG